MEALRLVGTVPVVATDAHIDRLSRVPAWLVFVESKEEEELSLSRQKRMDAERQQMQISATLADEMIEALRADDLERYTRLKALRKN